MTFRLKNQHIPLACQHLKTKRWFSEGKNKKHVFGSTYQFTRYHGIIQDVNLTLDQALCSYWMTEVSKAKSASHVNMITNSHGLLR